MPKVVINLVQRSIEVEGSEEFINKHLKIFQESMLPAVKDLSEKLVVQREKSWENDLETNSVKYQDQTVFSMDSSGGIHILKISGKTNTNKTRAIALLFLLAKKDLKNENSGLAEEIRDICKKFSCYDESNFARTLDEYNYIMAIGKSKSKKKSYELTIPGEKEARRLAEELSKNENPN